MHRYVIKYTYEGVGMARVNAKNKEEAQQRFDDGECYHYMIRVCGAVAKVYEIITEKKHNKDENKRLHGGK